MAKLFRLIFCFTLLLFACNTTQAQGFTRWDSVPVQVNGLTLKYPWSGGLNNCQTYRIDLNGDGLKDLFTYDKTSLKIRTYVNTGGAGQYQFVYSPQYETCFPGPLVNWVELFDFNCDGREDLFTFNNGYIQVWKNSYTPATGLRFSLYENKLVSKFSHNAVNGILLSAQTYPAFSDVDNDGDLDLLIYGTEVSFYQNMAKENDQRCDTLDFTFMDQCWGKFSSFGNPTHNTLTFGISCRGTGDQPDTLDRPMRQHSGQSILAIDLNGDSLKDVLIGDVIQNNITAAFNTGTAASAKFTSQDTAFPGYNVPAALFSMDVCHYLDIDNDSIRDLIISPYQSNISSDFKSVWYYHNKGTDSHPIFNYQQDNYLQEQMIEVGEGSAPVFLDYDGDGLQDIVVGNYGYFNSNYANGFQTNLSLYKNVGTPTTPSYKLITRNFAGIDSLGINGIYPAFGDLDGDGDQDMVLGQQNGHLLYFNNTAGAGNPCAFHLVSSYYDSINVGQYAAPQLIDVNRDGKLDLLIGKRNGALSYYQNTGTTTVPVFSSSPTNSNFGGVYVTKAGYVTGYSVPCLYNVAGNTYELLVGSESGFLYHYKNIDANLSGNFTLVDSAYGHIWEGLRATPALKDLNNDGSPDLVIGNFSGGLDLYKGPLNVSVQPIAPIDLGFKIWPNPAKSAVQFSYTSFGQASKASCTIYSVLGQVLAEFGLADNQKAFSYDVSTLPAGIYFCKLLINHTQQIQKLVIEK
jgi:hypothetical protein